MLCISGFLPFGMVYLLSPSLFRYVVRSLSWCSYFVVSFFRYLAGVYLFRVFVRSFVLSVCMRYSVRYFVISLVRYVFHPLFR